MAGNERDELTNLVPDWKTPKEWVEYLNKLNTRYMTREQASGFTKYALAGVLAYLGYRILEAVPLIFEQTYMFSVVFILLLNSYAVSICVSGIIGDKSDRYMENHFSQSWLNAYIPIYTCVVIIAIGISLWLGSYMKQIGYTAIVYHILAGVYVGFLARTLYDYTVHRRIRSRAEGRPVLDFYSRSYLGKRTPNVIGTVLYLFVNFHILSGLVWVDIVSTIDVVRGAIELFAFTYVYWLYKQKEPEDKKIDLLATLEQKVMLYQMSVEQISDEFREIMYNKSFNYWFRENEDHRKYLLSLISALDNKLNSAYSKSKEEIFKCQEAYDYYHETLLTKDETERKNLAFAETVFNEFYANAEERSVLVSSLFAEFKHYVQYYSANLERQSKALQFLMSQVSDKDDKAKLASCLETIDNELDILKEVNEFHSNEALKYMNQQRIMFSTTHKNEAAVAVDS